VLRDAVAHARKLFEYRAAAPAAGVLPRFSGYESELIAG
jgi:hypothetical protein